MTLTPRAIDAVAPHQVVGEIRSTRPVWLAGVDRPLRCGPEPSPISHRLGDHLVWTDGCLRCDHRGSNGAEDCNRLIYLLGGGLVTPRNAPIYILTQVTVEEMRYMKCNRLDWEAVVSYLGIGLLP